MLRSKKWQALRKQVLQRDNYICQNCGIKENLNVHHLHYIHGLKPVNQGLNTMITLCDNCHELEHSKKPISEFFINKSEAIKLYGDIYLAKNFEKEKAPSREKSSLNLKDQQRLSKLMSKINKKDRILQQRYDKLKK